MENKASEPEKKESPLQKSASQHSIQVKKHPTTLPSSKSSVSLSKPMEEKKKEVCVLDRFILITNYLN